MLTGAQTTLSSKDDQPTNNIDMIADEELNFRLREYVKSYHETIRKNSLKLERESNT